MKEIKYIPTVEGFSGYIILNLPGHEERTRKALMLGNDQDKVKSTMTFFANVKEHTKEVNLTFGEGEDAVSFSSIDELGYYEEGFEVINELGLVLTKGPKLGKSKTT
jgi:hypothetical protein